ncbi:serine/threonine-protein kinase [Dictyobacter formicarum]|uniref:non-specific serine/threonine protein kinase n=1 Tax=Dictyobacter formicarum TaxID=2778368 RepID=A0ABQ3VIH2_9CHLR|nr:serine/threonine-protein kinase [Dictyobacter formicarum]GHO85271.1 hypothetical protein KSZ_32770 [Dictyobacter formicarum]
MNRASGYLGKYELQVRLGRGGMAEVWKAWDPQLARFVAIKIMHSDLRSASSFMTRFVREGQAIASLRHPNIVQIHDLHVSDADAESYQAYMVMDYIEGPTLADYIHRTSHQQHFPSNGEIVQLFASIAQAIDYAHSRHIVHRDVKPGNILLDVHNVQRNPMGEPILTDFGIVKMLGSITVTAVGISMGTPLYIAPEVVQSFPANELSDIYSFGVMLYEMCTGIPPFQGDSAYAVMIQHVHSTPRIPSQVRPQLPAAVDSVILRSLAKDPTARFPTACALVEALAQAFELPMPEPCWVTNPSKEMMSRLDSDEAVSEGRSSFQPRTPTEQELPALADGNGSVTSTVEDRQTVVSERQTPTDSPIYSEAVPQANKNTDLGHPTGTAPRVTPPSPLLPSPGTNQPRNASAVKLAGYLKPVFRQHPFFYVLLAMITIVVVSTVAGGFFLLRQRSIIAVDRAHVGQLAFHSSQQLDAYGAQGFNDKVQLHLTNLSEPAPGNRYYAWLRDDKAEAAAILLGTLAIDQGQSSLAYVDPQHRDLLASRDELLVTEEGVRTTPNTPTLDKKLWRYQGGFSRTRSPEDNYSELDHLRHLLATEPNLAKLQLSYGVDYWFLNNVKQLQDSAQVVNGSSDLTVVRQQITDIIYFLDGACGPTTTKGLAIPYSPENEAIIHNTRVGLLDCAQQIEPPGHLTHMSVHLNGIVQSPGVMSSQIKRAIQINKDLNPIKSALVAVRKDALQLGSMNDAQLGTAQPLRNDLLIEANQAVNGSINPDTQLVEPSAMQICNSIELLATFDVKAVGTR